MLPSLLPVGLSLILVEHVLPRASFRESLSVLHVTFVIDAFDGKVSDILSKTKHDNYGTLKQKIRDSYALVNHHGAAFRNARITDQYAASRMDELQWAVATKELQRKSREEQREIREKMREEERVRRELEKAQQEAEKEARTVEEALRKAQEQFSNSSQEERSAFQTKIDELEAELKEAQWKGERAISMAQQTRRGHVYIISNVGSFGDGIYKIGMTRRLEPLDRVKELGDASVPFPFDVHAMIESTDAPLLESALHDEFSLHRVNRVNKRKEFFHAPLAEIRRLVEARKMMRIGQCSLMRLNTEKHSYCRHENEAKRSKPTPFIRMNLQQQRYR